MCTLLELERVCHRRHLVPIAAQHRHVVPHNALAVRLAREVGRRRGRRPRLAHDDLDSRQLDRVWVAVLEGERVAQLPDSDQLPGTPIIVTDRRGDSWTATLKEVVSRSDTEIVVTNTGRPRR